MTVSLVLPWPPSLNTYWRHLKNGRTLLSADAKAYRESVYYAVLKARAQAAYPEERLLVRIVAPPPDQRRRDLDNLLKAVLDALQAAGLYADDAQIDDLHIIRGPATKSGELHLHVEVVAGLACERSKAAGG